MNFNETPYSILWVHRFSDEAEIKSAYRALVSIMHPDRLGNTSEANEAFAKVTSAAAVLLDTKARREYDTKLDLLSSPCSNCSGKGFVLQKISYATRIKNVCGICEGCGRCENVVKNRKSSISL